MKGAAAIRNASATIGSQGVSSLTNFLPPALVLTSSDLATFGRFALVFQACQLVVTVAQGSLGEAILVHFRGSDDEGGDHARFLSGASAIAVATGLVFGLVFASLGMLLGGDVRTMLLVAAFGAPGLAGQYVLRAGYFAAERPVGALVADVVWLFVVVAAATGDALGLWTMSAAGYLGAWLFGATVSAGPTLLRGAAARSVDCSTFATVAGRQSVRLGIEAALARSVYVVFLLLAAVVLSAESSGAIASAVLVFSPLSVVYVAISTFLVPTLVRTNGIHVVAPGVLARIAVVAAGMTSAWMIVLALANMVDLAPGPFDLEIAEVSHALFFATGARFVGLSVWRAPLIALRVADATRESLAARWAATLAQWTLPVLGLSIGGLEWGAVLFAVATWFGAYLALAQWLALRRAGGAARAGDAERG